MRKQQYVVKLSGQARSRLSRGTEGEKFGKAPTESANTVTRRHRQTGIVVE